MTTARKFHRVYAYVAHKLDELGIPFGADPDCEVFFVASRWEPDSLRASYYRDGEITLCRNHMEGSIEDCAVILMHEITHYWCDVFPRVMMKGHAFRVPRASMLDSLPALLRYLLKAQLHERLFDAADPRFVGAYSQVDSEECLADFMANWVIHRPDLRSVRSELARARYRACARMLKELSDTYAGWELTG